LFGLILSVSFFAHDLLHSFGLNHLATDTANDAASNTAVKPLTLPKAAYLTLTTGGAANAKAAEITVLVHGELVGVVG
jgi:hypothetical protein